MEGGKWIRSFEVRRMLSPVMVYKTIKVVDLFQTTRAICLLTMVVSATGGKLAIPQPPQTIAELALAIGMQCCGIASNL